MTDQQPEPGRFAVLHPGDRVLITLPVDTSRQQIDGYTTALRDRFPDVDFTFIGADGVTISSEPDLDNIFTYHPPQPGDPEAYQRIRAEGHNLALAIMADVPPCHERDKALDAIREAVMWANAGRACNPASSEE